MLPCRSDRQILSGHSSWSIYHNCIHSHRRVSAVPSKFMVLMGKPEQKLVVLQINC